MLLFPAAAEAQARTARTAGKISARLPVDYVLRGRQTLEGVKDLPLLWGDIVKTERGGRVRIVLEDGSILNVGSQSQLRIEEHDSQAQRTGLQLAYGRMRASVVRIANPAVGSFSVRTNAAVAGVVGTDEYLEATDIVTTVIALGGGLVTVTSTDPRYPDPILLNPGEAATLVAGKPPGPKRQATTDELQNAVQETEVDSVARLTPGETLAGQTFTATVEGKGLQNTTRISSTRPGIEVRMSGAPTATRIPISVSVAADVPAGSYSLVIERPEGPALALLVVTTAAAQQAAQAAANEAIQPPPAVNLSAIRGAKFTLDASATRTPAGTQIVSYQWKVVNTNLASNSETFFVNTSLLPPGNYAIQLVVVNDRGQTATQTSSLTVSAGVQPAEIVRELALAYESLQPDQFLKQFDEQRFRNFSGFSAEIQDSFRNRLETMRVFQRPVNCTTLEEQDQAVCQADFELQFTLKNQAAELLDAQGNPVPPGTTPPPGATLGKRTLTGNERNTIRFERADQGWKITDYAAVVTCPGGASTNGLNVGSCVIAAGSKTAPSFQLSNLQVFSPDLPLGGSVSGTFDVVPLGGFSRAVNFTAQAQVGGQNLQVTFAPNPASAPATVGFTVTAPTMPPPNFTGALPFTLVITGTDSTGTITASGNVAMQLQPNFTLTVTPTSSSTAPIGVQHNQTLNVGVQVVPGAGFSGGVLVDFPNLPTGFQATGGNVAAGAVVNFPVQVTPAAAPGPAIITVRATVGTGLVKTFPVFVDVTSDFTLNVIPATSPAAPAQVNANRTLNLSVQIVPVSGFAGSVLIDFPNPPAGFQPTSGTVAAGQTGAFPVFVVATTPLGIYQLTVRGSVGGSSQTATVFVQVLVALIPIAPPTSASSKAPIETEGTARAVKPTAAATKPGGEVSVAGEAADLMIRAEDVTMQPANPMPGQTVRFRIRVTNGGAKAVENAALEFSIAGTAVRQRESVSLKAGEAQTFEYEWVAEGRGKLEPRVVLDPEGLTADTNRANNRVTLPAFVLDAASATAAGVRKVPAQQWQFRVAAGGCISVRLDSGREGNCDGSGDLEIRVSSTGEAMYLESDGVRPLGTVTLDSVREEREVGGMGSAQLLPNMTYVVKTLRGAAAVRVAQVRGLRGGKRLPPEPLRGPGSAGGAIERVGREEGPAVLVTLEWRWLAERQ